VRIIKQTQQIDWGGAHRESDAIFNLIRRRANRAPAKSHVVPIIIIIGNLLLERGGGASTNTISVRAYATKQIMKLRATLIGRVQIFCLFSVEKRLLSN
jgi:hypothetical protein